MDVAVVALDFVLRLSNTCLLCHVTFSSLVHTIAFIIGEDIPCIINP